MKDLLSKIEIIEEYKNSGTTYGHYIVTYNGKKYIFTRNGCDVKAIIHFSTEDTLERVDAKMRDSFLKKLEESKD
jgi:hypothetical protein